jgi:hypothetical protein
MEGLGFGGPPLQLLAAGRASYRRGHSSESSTAFTMMSCTPEQERGQAKPKQEIRPGKRPTAQPCWCALDDGTQPGGADSADGEGGCGSHLDDALDPGYGAQVAAHGLEGVVDGRLHHHPAPQSDKPGGGGKSSMQPRGGQHGPGVGRQRS